MRSAYWDGAKGVCCDKTVMKAMGGDNHYACCENEQTAYWNGSSALCCDTATNAIVTNYINGQTETAYACCEVKEDSYSSDNVSTGWTLAGAVNGSCCGGYASKSEELRDYNHTLMSSESWTQSYEIRKNGGIFYCARNFTYTTEYDSGRDTYEHNYESDGKYCSTWNGLLGSSTFSETTCLCSDSGDPQNGSSCDP